MQLLRLWVATASLRYLLPHVSSVIMRNTKNIWTAYMILMKNWKAW